ncbi:MAG: transporter [Armatimonadota bacterium]|nr:transporter [Armatimonadota bacterium]
MNQHVVSKTRACVVALLGALAIAALCVPASAQTQPWEQWENKETAFGGGVDTIVSNGGQTVRVIDGRPTIRPLPAQSDFSTALEYETWSGEGRRSVDGHRTTLLLGYTRGLSPTNEFALTVPLQQVKVSGYVDETGIGDVELAMRHFFYNPQAENGPTVVLSGKVFLPTGDADKAIGLGEFSYGASLNGTLPVGAAGLTSAYAGVGYTVVGEPSGVDLKNVLYYWAGGITQMAPRWNLQYEALRFNSPANEKYTRALLGVRYGLTPSAGLQFNVKREFQADGNPTTISIGYSSRL